MSEFTKKTFSNQRIPETDTLSGHDIAFYVERGKQLHARVIREALHAAFYSVGKATDRMVAAIGQAFHKAGPSASQR